MAVLLAALMAEVRPSKPCSPATLLFVNPVRSAAAVALAAAACLVAFRVHGGRPRGVSCALAAAFGAAFLPLRASALARVRRLTVRPRCKVIRLKIDMKMQVPAAAPKRRSRDREDVPATRNGVRDTAARAPVIAAAACPA
jgi:hypothetical protein